MARVIVGLGLCIAASGLLLIATGATGLAFYGFDLHADTSGSVAPSFNPQISIVMFCSYALMFLSLLVQVGGVIVVLTDSKRFGNRLLCAAYFPVMLVGVGLFIGGFVHMGQDSSDMLYKVGDLMVMVTFSMLVLNIAACIPVVRLTPLPVTLGAAGANVIFLIVLAINVPTMWGARLSWFSDHKSGLSLTFMSICIWQAALIVSIAASIAMRRRYLSKGLKLPQAQDEVGTPQPPPLMKG